MLALRSFPDHPRTQEVCDKKNGTSGSSAQEGQNFGAP